MMPDQANDERQSAAASSGRLSRVERGARWAVTSAGASTLLIIGLTGLAAADPLMPLQTFCETPFIGDTFSWLWPVITKAMMAIGGLVFLYGVIGPASEGRGRLSMGQAIFLGVALFFVGFQWEPMWTYIGGIYGEPGGNINALTCGM